MTEAAEIIHPRELPGEVREYLDKFDLSACMTCGSCVSGCPTSCAPGYEDWNTRKVLRMLSLGMLQEVVDSNYVWLCTGCGRCTQNCPAGVDIAPLMLHLKHLRDRDKVPGTLHKGAQQNLDTGNNLGIPLEDYLQGMAELGAEMAEEECPGFYVPVDKDGAEILFFPNSKEVYGDFEDQYWWWKIFYAARENWTVPSTGWEAVDWALFTGNYEGTRKLARRKIDYMRQHGIKRMIMPDCGGGSYGCRTGLKYCLQESPETSEVEFIYLYEYLKEIIEQGRITLDKSVHAGKRFTFHDSCKHGRELMRHYGQAFFEEPRWILSQCVDEYVDLVPNRMANFCCGAGGGMWPMPFEEQAAYHGRFKVEQIKRSGADVVVVGCSNCRDQIMKRLPKYYEGCDYEVKYIWQVVAEALVIEPLEGKELEKAEAEAAEQWERLGIDLDVEY
ncbi:(Fe-S)-binding protein [Desulfohalovibrio reitneri]|uniref:(Fe-S)-binding protein n=1 Tax=Desulfohalovibrio reitneri TaxID=1307759 RepID=UPI0004A70F8D|nr:(Fe-S)-binding protein [Desulfohalovibrio reitneri]